MLRQIIGALASALIILLVGVASRKSLVMASIFASLPVTSILALTWLYKDGQSIENIQSIAVGILLMIIPSLSFFIAIAGLLRFGLGFYTSLLSSCVITVICYAAYNMILSRLGISL